MKIKNGDQIITITMTPSGNDNELCDFSWGFSSEKPSSTKTGKSNQTPKKKKRK
jgi:hypothetical protein